MGQNNPFLKFLTAEDHIAFLFCIHIRETYPDLLWWHVVNEGKRTPFEKFKISHMGILAGVSDYMFIHPKGGRNMIMELKSETGKLSREQSDFIEKMIYAGWEAFVCWGLEQAQFYLKKWYDAEVKPKIS